MVKAAEGRKRKSTQRRVLSTHEAIDFALTGWAKVIGNLRVQGNNILTLQAINHIAAGNPMMIFGNELLARECIATSENVRLWCLRKFKEHGGGGPEVMDRVLGYEGKILRAANQALHRFAEIVTAVREQQEEMQAAAQGQLSPAKAARRNELLQRQASAAQDGSTTPVLTEAEQHELEALGHEARNAFLAHVSARAQGGGVAPPTSAVNGNAPAPGPLGEIVDDDMGAVIADDDMGDAAPGEGEGEPAAAGGGDDPLLNM